jgi:fatty aldehyde-generating acyl-ACP reductase
MDKFGFVIHNTDWRLISRAFDEPLLDFEFFHDDKKKRMAERVFRWAPPFNCSEITGIRSLTGREISGHFIFSMLVPEQYLCMRDEVVVQHLVKAGKMAKSMGAKILGLGAYSALVGRRGLELPERIDLPVTTGSTYTVVSIIDAIYLAAEKIRLDTERSSLVIVGATGKIGSVCARIFAMSGQFEKIYLVARNETRLNNLLEEVEACSKGGEIIVTTDLKAALREGNVVLFTTNYPETIADAQDFCPGSIICDVSVPKNVPETAFKQREDIILIEGGIIRPPGKVDFNFHFGPEQGLTYACIAETMILTLEKRFENYSLGNDIDIKKVIEIRELAQKHGFTVEALKTHYGDISDTRLAKVRNVVSKRKKNLVLK